MFQAGTWWEQSLHPPGPPLSPQVPPSTAAGSLHPAEQQDPARLTWGQVVLGSLHTQQALSKKEGFELLPPGSSTCENPSMASVKGIVKGDHISRNAQPSSGLHVSLSNQHPCAGICWNCTDILRGVRETGLRDPNHQCEYLICMFCWQLSRDFEIAQMTHFLSQHFDTVYSPPRIDLSHQN